MRVSRSRSRGPLVSSTFAGTNVSSTGTVNHTVPSGYHHEVCDDSVGDWPVKASSSSGGPFTLVRRTWIAHPSEKVQFSYTGGQSYRGVLFADFLSYGGFPSDNLAPILNLSDYGVVGYARTKPGTPVFDFGQFIGELKDLPGFVKQTKAGIQAIRRDTRHLSKRNSTLWGREVDIRKLASANLYAQFGLVPLVNDLVTIYNLSERLRVALAQLRRDNGKIVRRSIPLRNQTTLSESVVSQYAAVRPLLTAGYVVSPGYRREISITKSVEIWYNARFRYWIPDINTPAWNRRARALLSGNPLEGGLSLQTLWELTPWSFLIDYFSNVQENLSNMSKTAAENLHALDAWVMARQRWDSRMLVSGQGSRSPFSRFVCRAEGRMETLQRSRASRFGLSSDANLSLKQAGIVASLLGQSLPRRPWL